MALVSGIAYLLAGGRTAEQEPTYDESRSPVVECALAADDAEAVPERPDDVATASIDELLATLASVDALYAAGRECSR